MVGSLATKTSVSTSRTPSPVRPSPKKNPTSDEIAKRAWEIWNRKGRRPGGELENWLEAERELRG
ncbi:MAG: DUF2934 domain-containing protein [Deltaproteobacteria bacterium]|nr:DUF2934 domain-containing protein [Deltaproteobacteria bacterium]